VPKAVKEPFDLDCKNGNTFWANTIAKEVKEVCIAFKILPDRHAAPIGYQKILCYMVFDIKMEDFQRKAELVAGNYKTELQQLSPMPV
jgi:hypothetical protein